MIAGSLPRRRIVHEQLTNLLKHLGVTSWNLSEDPIWLNKFTLLIEGVGQKEKKVIQSWLNENVENFTKVNVVLKKSNKK